MNKRDVLGRTALMWAVFRKKCGLDKYVNHCLKAGAQINLIDNEGHNALTKHLMWYESDKVVMLLYTAGETIDETKVQVPDYLKDLIKEPPDLSLKHWCRETIRKHLMNIDQHENLFGRIPQLGLPSSLSKYLLYNVSLDDDDDDDCSFVTTSLDI